MPPLAAGAYRRSWVWTSSKSASRSHFPASLGLHRSGPVPFWFENPPTHDELARRWRAVGKTLEQVFPVRYNCLVTIDGRNFSGDVRYEDVVCFAR